MGLEALSEVRKGSGVPRGVREGLGGPSAGLGWVGMASCGSRRDQGALPKVREWLGPSWRSEMRSRRPWRGREAHPKVQVGSEAFAEVLVGPCRGPGGVRRSSRRSGWGQEAIAKVWVGSGGHRRCPGGIGRPFERSRRGQEALVEVR